MEVFIKHKEFIQGLKLGNCPNPDNETLKEVVAEADKVGIKTNWICTCDKDFADLVDKLYKYCEDNNWNIQTKKKK
jgi:hypothetical protein